ncbi:DMT family transporter [Nocardioides sp. CFH 31398]|uniref:EamA family transporter n=1 Tax=Nocardioides sp. CFH 31398 TaxID=2919579 RepID=UPI001F06218E|nr:EamA family transporter [Nocardioides sp. CFH 31398]MCH1868843.1 DMT family transporter [Nocardioides sp. CFH 31398]
MGTMTPDARTGTVATGLAFALVSATAFGLAGPLARGLLDEGWSAGAAVLVRVGIAAVVLAVPTAVVLRGRWGLLAANARLVTLYGLAAVAGIQLAFFYAVTYLDVGVALLIEYTAPVAVVLWMWLRHAQRPGRLTLLGAVVAAAGLVLVLDVLSGASLDPVGVLWALAAMLGLAVYFVVSADVENGLPPIVLAEGGLVVGTTVLGLAGLVGLVPMTASTAPASYAGSSLPWWVAALGLGVVCAALAYATGVAAGRRLGSRLASFVGLSEVVAALVFSVLLLAELPGPLQLLGGVLVLVGVLLVRAGEPAAAQPLAEVPPGPPVVEDARR